MSSPQLEWPLAADAVSLLSDSECLLLLDADIDIIDFDGDLLRSLPCATSKLEWGVAGAAEFGEDPPSPSTLLYPPSPLECKPSRAQLAADQLQQLDTQCKIESFPSWLEEKVELPIFEHVPPASCDVPLYAGAVLPPIVVPPAAPPAPLKSDDTAELLREFETVYNGVELTHLTPPQSPPGPATQLLLSYAQNAQAPLAPAVAPSAAPASPWPAHLEREMAMVEEVMRHSSAHLASSPSSPSSPSTPHRRTFSSSASASSSAGSGDDEDWERERPARSKPYSRSTEDRRSRKKEQNKNAATRYRQKKKAEVEVLLSEESALRQRQGELGTKCADLQREIRYLKGLMRDLFKAKGLIK